MLTLLQNPFVGVYELRKNLPKILGGLKRDGSPVVITQQGKPAAVVMAVEYYLELIEAIRDLREPEYLEKLNEAVDEVKKGGGMPAEKLYRELKLR